MNAKAAKQLRQPGLLNPWAAALALSAILVFTELAQGQSVKPEDQVPVSKRWSLIAGLGQSQNLYYTNSGQEQASTDASFAVRVRLAPKTLLNFAVAASFDNKTEDSDWSQASMGISQSQIPLFNAALLWTPSASAQLPASRRNLASSMIGIVGLSSRLDVNSEKQNWTRFSAAYLTSVSQAFYEFDTSVSGEINQPLRLSQGLEISWAFTDKVFAVLFASHGLRRSAFGEWRESLTHVQELYAQISPQWGLSLGHQLGSSLRAANGQDLNLRLSSESESIVYLQNSFVF